MTCHKSPCYLRPCSQDGKPAGKYCPPCGRVEPADGIAETPPEQRRSTPQNPRTIAPQSAQTAVRAKRDKYPTETEAGLVRAIVEALQLSGYTVLRVGQYRADLAGQTPGTPDLFVRGPDYDRGLWISMEVKTERGRMSPAQSALYQAGHIYVVRSPQEALQIMRGAGE